MNKSFRILIAAAVLVFMQSASASSVWQPGFIILAEDRFDPAIQRLMAEHSLRSLPLDRGRLYYLYPPGVTPRLEGIQIRYLETLLEKRAAREETEAADTASEPANP